MEHSSRADAAGARVPLASLRPVLEYGWPAGARWLAGEDDSEGASLEAPVGRQVAFRLRVDEGWRLRATAALPRGAAPAAAWVRVALREPGARERVVWSGILGRAGRPRSRDFDADLGAVDGEVDLVLRAVGLGTDRVRWIEPTFHRGGLAWRP